MMPINIKDPEADALAREVAAMRNQPITDAVKDALRDLRLKEEAKARERFERRMEAGRRFAAAMDAAPVQDPRPWRDIRADAWGDEER